MTTTYTPPPITGYRKLTQAEVDLVNTIKAEGARLEALVGQVREYLSQQSHEAVKLVDDELRLAEADRLSRAEAPRWASIARTHFQEGLMALARAVAQPTTF